MSGNMVQAYRASITFIFKVPSHHISNIRSPFCVIIVKLRISFTCAEPASNSHYNKTRSPNKYSPLQVISHYVFELRSRKASFEKVYYNKVIRAFHQTPTPLSDTN